MFLSNLHGDFAPRNTIHSNEEPIFRPRTPDSDQSTHLSNIGDSSSLFSYRSPPAFGFAANKQNNSPISFVFGASDKQYQSHNKMVNDRSPAKVPFVPVIPNEIPSSMADSSYPSKPLPTTIPQFGQPTLPQSPLPRPAQKQSNVFLQPKSRPEHHRDAQGMLIYRL